MEKRFIDRWIYNNLPGEPTVDKEFSDIFFKAKYQLEDLPIHAVKDGVYWSKAKDNKIITIFESRDGNQEEIQGKLIQINDKGIVVEVRRNNNENGIFFDYYIFEEDKEPLKLPEKPWIVKPFGNYLIYNNYEDSKYYIYNQRQIDWNLFQGKGDIYLPVQEYNTFYRRIAN